MSSAPTRRFGASATDQRRSICERLSYYPEHLGLRISASDTDGPSAHVQEKYESCTEGARARPMGIFPRHQVVAVCLSPRHDGTESSDRGDVFWRGYVHR